MAIDNKTLKSKVAETFSNSVDPRPKAPDRPVPKASGRTVGVTRGRNYGQIELSRIITDPNQPRTEFDAEEIRRLAESLKSETGQIQAILVRWLPEYSKYMVVTGERRFRAAQLADLPAIECKIAGDDIDEQELRKTQIVENLLREDLKPLEEANSIQAFKESNALTGKQTAVALGISESRVSRALKLLTLPKDIQQQVERGTVSRTVAYEISKLDNQKIQQQLATEAAGGNLSKRIVGKAVRKRKGRPARQSLTKTLKFQCRHEIEIQIKVPAGHNYHHVREAVDDLIEDVDTRLSSNVGI